MTTKLHRLAVQVHAPTADYVGMVEEGQYLLGDDTVTLVTHAGVPLRSRKGEKYEKKLAPGETPHMVASRLVRQRWRDRGGEKKSFSRPLTYPKLVY